MGLLPETEPFLSLPDKTHADDPEAVTLIEYGLLAAPPLAAEAPPHTLAATADDSYQ